MYVATHVRLNKTIDRNQAIWFVLVFNDDELNVERYYQVNCEPKSTPMETGQQRVISLVLWATVLLVTSTANPQNDSLFRFASVTTSMNQIEFAEPSTERNDVVITESMKETHLMKETEEGSAQCLYDFQGNRMTKGCAIKERPPMCSRGSLVQTLVGTNYEMCCCNY